MKYNITQGKKHIGDLEIEYLDCINYTMILNRGECIQKFLIHNVLQSDSLASVHIRIQGDMFNDVDVDLGDVAPDTQVSAEEIRLMPDVNKLMALTEAFHTQFEVQVETNGVKFKQALPITLMAFDQWMGTKLHPELLAAFVTPNHPLLVNIIQRTSELCRERFGCDTLDGYFSNDRQKVMAQIESVFLALKERNIVYVLCPASFEDEGQRIRLAENVLQNKVGTCLDLSLLLCSIFEQLGFCTSVFFFDGHAFIGVWIAWGCELPMTDYDYEFIRRESQLDMPNLLLIEATALTRADDTFEDACNQALGYFLEHQTEFQLYVNILSCRKHRIRPLPQCMNSGKGWLVNDDTDYEKLLDDIIKRHSQEIRGSVSQKVIGKQQIWERKLLDLALRNSLINMKKGKQIVMLAEAEASDVLGLLRTGKLDTLMDEKKAFNQTKELYRAARLAIEENGANCLFLTLGTMRWYEEGGSEPHFAPILLIPIEIVRHSPKQYVIRRRDDDASINITLIECLKQVFDLAVPDYTQLPETQDGEVDYQTIFRELAAVITDKRNWAVVENESVMGVFLFKKFVMWHDIHSCPHVVQKHPLLSSLMQGEVKWDYEPTEKDLRLDTEKGLMPTDLAIPIDVDSSQLKAVYASGNDRTFILYGPPGTGKSQTITNMIANALYQGKRVLFVSEKKAALEVVQERLAKIGLGDFCMELHSNKSDKKHFLTQLENALLLPCKSHNKDFEKIADEKRRHREELNHFVEALHAVREDGHSLFEYINLYLDAEGKDMVEIGHKASSAISDAELEQICSQLQQLDTVQHILGVHPSRHPLLEILPRQNTIDNQEAITTLLPVISARIAKAEKKERGLINRWFYKKTANEILHQSEEWKNLNKMAWLSPEVTDDLEHLKALVPVWEKNIYLLRPWYHYSLRALALGKLHSQEAMDFYLQGQSGTNTAEALRKGICYERAMHIINHDEHLRSFNGMLFEQVIANYRKIIKDFQQLTKDELYCRLVSKIPALGTDKDINRELTRLNKSISSHGRGVTIRRVVENIPHILPRLAPCMLMSPLSVSQYLTMENNLFDLVLFDEASQIPTSEAVGAIARSKAVVVVGDPKQMPPTNFFNTNTANEEEVEYDDLESILDDCISLSMPSHYLSWHYRSQHESLIAFSNIHFYDGRLVTFPSVDDQCRRVTFCPVEGYYDYGKSRNNKAEAKTIVVEVMSRLEAQRQSGEFHSIGIVAFSKVQSSLIEDMLGDELAKNPELDEIASKGSEPIFVKNLENVQGDERDVILFSVGYGPDRQGKVSMNFGPLNQSGGERRLNVAVTRARQEIKVFSTLQPEQIDLSRTSAKGVLNLKRFLEYARDGQLPVPYNQIRPEEQDKIAKQIAKSIESLGYRCIQNVGRSRCKVDIAVTDADNPNAYLFGVLLDGTNYCQQQTARDREMVLPQVLNRLGWKLIRVWTIDWLCDEDKAKERLATAIQMLLCQ